jgi:hypothetical protein
MSGDGSVVQLRACKEDHNRIDQPDSRTEPLIVQFPSRIHNMLTKAGKVQRYHGRDIKDPKRLRGVVSDPKKGHESP